MVLETCLLLVLLRWMSDGLQELETWSTAGPSFPRRPRSALKMLTRPSFLALGLTAAAPLIHAFPSTLRFPVDSESSHGPESTLSSLNITTPLSVVGNQGPYSPYISQTSYLPRTVPEGWNVDQVSIIMRHGARFPTKNAGKRIDASLALLDNRTSIADADFAFVDGYTFSDYTADELSDFGRRECFDAGVKFKAQYADLTDNSDSFFRTAGDGRVVESSGFFLQGWNGAKFDLNATLDVPPVVSYLLRCAVNRSSN